MQCHPHFMGEETEILRGYGQTQVSDSTRCCVDNHYDSVVALPLPEGKKVRC